MDEIIFIGVKIWFTLLIGGLVAAVIGLGIHIFSEIWS